MSKRPAASEPSSSSPHDLYEQSPKKSRCVGEEATEEEEHHAEKDEEDAGQDEVNPGVSGVKEYAINNEGVEKEEEVEAKPVGDAVRTSGRGRSKMLHYAAFEIHNTVIGLEEAMLLVPEQPATEPYIGILKDVKARANGRNVILRVQWLYRSNEALKEDGEPWPAHDREIFMSFHLDDVMADAVMHKCVVHYVSPEVDLEAKRQKEGFFVRRVYDFHKKVLLDLTDVSGFKVEERKQIERLLQQTQEAWKGTPNAQEQKPETQQQEANDGSDKHITCSNVASKVLESSGS